MERLTKNRLKRIAAAVILLPVMLAGCTANDKEPVPTPADSHTPVPATPSPVPTTQPDSVEINNTEILQIESFDGYMLEAKIDYPDVSEVEKLVIFVNGSGPNTYDNTLEYGEKKLNFFDLYAEEFTKRDIAFFRYSTRGCEIGEAPSFVSINEQEYQTYLPLNSVEDIKCMIKYLKEQPRLKNAEIYLLGASEGTIIAPLVALDKDVQVDGLLLTGYVNDNLSNIMNWQLSGGSSMIFFKRYFDLDNKGYITKADYEADKFNVRAAIGNNEFNYYDVNSDGIIDESDFNTILKPRKEAIFNAIECGDDAWLKNNYEVILTSGWFKEHFALAPTSQILPQIDIPIHIFHGEFDQNTPVECVAAIEETFKELGKDNLTTHIFAGHDHSLNYSAYLVYGAVSEGLNSLFSVLSAQ